MIIGSTLRGDVVSDQPATAGVRLMQDAMIALSRAKNDPNFAKNMTSSDGKVGARTVYSLIKISQAGLGAIPVIGGVLNSTVGLPLKAAAWNYEVFTSAWNAARDSYGSDLLTYVIQPIASAAAAINTSIGSILRSIVPQTTPPSTTPPSTSWLTTVGPIKATYEIHYPPGTVGVRNPLIGKFHILIPVVK